MLEKDGIVYKLFQLEDLERAIACMVDVFPSGEPLAQVLGITKEEFYPFAEIVGKIAVKEEISHIAKDVETGEAVGFIISEDLVRETNKESPFLENNFKTFYPIMELLENLETQYMKSREIKKRQVIHCFMVGVRENYRNRNIAKTLLDINLQEAKQKNFSIAICEATGIISQHNAAKMGFKEIVEIAYKDYTYQGQKVFERIEPHTRCVLMEKVLDISKLLVSETEGMNLS